MASANASACRSLSLVPRNLKHEREWEEEKPQIVKKAKVDENEGEEQQDGSIRYTLSAKKFVTVKEMKGKKFVDLREFYEKDGDMKPGKKGICLPFSQWMTICDLEGPITTAMGSIESNEPASTEDTIVFDITNKRRISVQKFHGHVLVQIREFYTAENQEMKPGKKGCALTAIQWNRLMYLKEQIQASADNLS